VNEGYKQSYGVVDPQSEAVHLFGGDVDVDRSIVDLQGPEARAAQTEMKVRSMRLTLEAALINGDATASQGRGFDGLAKRLMPGSEMALNNGGGALDFDKLDELIDSVNSYGGKKYLVMSKAMRRQLNALARATVGQGVYNVSTNNLGVMVHHYQECQILTVDRDAQGLEVLGYGEAGGTSSIYRCTFGDQGSQRHYALLALSCDLSFKGEAESDYCGFCLAGQLAPPARGAIPRSGESQWPTHQAELEIEVLWTARHRFGLPEVIRFLLGCLEALEHQGLRPNAVLIEDAANGPAVLQTLRRRVPGMLPITARGSKETRAHAVAPLVEAGQIRFHHRAQPLVEEAIRFPKGSKDLVDAFCHGALWLEGRYWKAQGIQPVVTPLLVSR
jgi:predicted phage terminase large subunit-like protein